MVWIAAKFAVITIDKYLSRWTFLSVMDHRPEFLWFQNISVVVESPIPNYIGFIHQEADQTHLTNECFVKLFVFTVYMKTTTFFSWASFLFLLSSAEIVGTFHSLRQLCHSFRGLCLRLVLIWHRRLQLETDSYLLGIRESESSPKIRFYPKCSSNGKY